MRRGCCFGDHHALTRGGGAQSLLPVTLARPGALSGVSGGASGAPPTRLVRGSSPSSTNQLDLLVSSSASLKLSACSVDEQRNVKHSSEECPWMCSVARQVQATSPPACCSGLQGCHNFRLASHLETHPACSSIFHFSLHPKGQRSCAC